jgi:hypothetical protein
MPTPKKPRKARKLVSRKDVVSTLFNADEPMQGEEKLEVLTSAHMAALALSRGTGTKNEWDTLVVTGNIAIVLCESAGNRNIGLEPLYAMQNAMIAVCERFQEIGRFVLTGDELQAMNAGIALFEQLVDTVSRRQYVRACAEYTRRLHAGKAVQIRRGQATERFALRQAA